MIVSTFEVLYPGMRDRAYFSVRAILQINTGARFRSRDHASRYRIPVISSSPHRHADTDFRHVTRMLEFNSHPDRPTVDFPREGTNTPLHSLWMSNLLVDLTRIGPNPTLRSCESYCNQSSSYDRQHPGHLLHAPGRTCRRRSLLGHRQIVRTGLNVVSKPN